MNIELGRFVPKVRRSISETSIKTAESLGFETLVHDTAAPPPQRLVFDRFVLDLARGCCLTGGRELYLRPKTFEVLVYLATHAGRVVPKEELLDAVWPSVCVTEDSVVQCITELRSALDDHRQRIIRTVPRRGYRFEIVPKPEVSGKPSRNKARIVMVVVAAVFVMGGVLTTVLFSGNGTERSSAPPFSIVVLPFANLGADPTGEYLGEGIAVDIITELSRLPGLFVIAPATARTLENAVDDPREIGSLLNVRYVLEGSVRGHGDDLRITAQLANAQTGATLWAERFDSAGHDLRAWQDDLIGRVANSLNYKLTRLESDQSRDADPENPAFDLAIRGWALIYSAKNPGNYDAARTLFRRALDSDPRSIKALTGLGWASAVTALIGWSDDPQAAMSEAEGAIARARALDTDNVVVQHVRGFLLRLRHRPEAAHDAFRVATDLSPSFDPSHAQLGATALELGRPHEAIAAVEEAMRFSPRDPSLGPWQAILGRAYLQLEQYDLAAVWLARSIETGTPIVLTHAYLASALALGGLLEEAEEALGVFLAQRPRMTLARFMEKDLRYGSDYVTRSRHIYEGLRIAGLPE